MLRAIGMSRRQLRRMLLGESLTLGVAAGLVGAALGVVVSRYWLVSTLTAVLGFTVPVVVPWAALAASVGAALFVGSTTGLAAAERAARITIDQALREE